MVPNAPPPALAYLLPFFFVALWLVITLVLTAITGWPTLAKQYPDRPETPLRSWIWQSGSMRGVSMRSILKIYACPGGLRIGIMRIFGPFSRNFFVPWADLKIEKTKFFFMDATRLTTASGLKLTLYGASGRELPDIAARAQNAPLSEAIVRESLNTNRHDILTEVLRLWLIRTGLASAFFIIAPMLVHARGGPPLGVCIGFPAIVFGLNALFSYLYQSRRT